MSCFGITEFGNQTAGSTMKFIRCFKAVNMNVRFILKALLKKGSNIIRLFYKVFFCGTSDFTVCCTVYGCTGFK